MAKEIIAKIEAGTSLTDGELRTAVKFYAQAELMLGLLGREFVHAKRAVTEQLETLERYIEARKS